MEKVNRWIFYILGMVVLAAGITLNTKTGLGVSPIISVAYCVSQIFELNFGDMTFVLYGIFVVVQLFLRERRERLATLLQFPLSLVFSRLLNLCSACIPYQAAAHSLPENLAVLALALDGTMWLDLPGDFFDMIVYVDWSDWLLLLELLLLCLAAGAVCMLHIYASIAVGHLARKHRTLAAFGAYFGFAVALNILFTGMLEIFVSSPWMAEIGRWFMELKGDTGGHLLMWLLILGIAVLGAGFFVLTRYLLKNHLNLE